MGLVRKLLLLEAIPKNSIMEILTQEQLFVCQLLIIYKAQIRPVLEYCFPYVECSTQTYPETIGFCPKKDRQFVSWVMPRSRTHSLLWNTVEELAIWLYFIEIFMDDALLKYQQLFDPPLTVPARITRRVEASHPFEVTLDTCRTFLSKDSFIQRTARFWNTLPREVFPEAYNLQKFKRNSNSYLISLWFSRCSLNITEDFSFLLRNVDNINMDLATILEWGSNNLIDFNANKTQACLFSRKAQHKLVRSNHTFEGIHFDVWYYTISNNVSWENHVRSIIAKRVQLRMIYKAQIRPVLEYCFHIWSAAPKHTLKLLDSVQKRAIRLVGDASLTNSLTPLDIFFLSLGAHERESLFF
ncbi:unnamed protein product [Phaedon cochleariae]|uniref:Uncharacterized protein n=1 Tax=Phaedon cochleariae TaxID=80249 RepID=A0A9N9SIR1_PHACE|nr:unnamed protein product [Phaedon cochleariae]